MVFHLDYYFLRSVDYDIYLFLIVYSSCTIVHVLFFLLCWIFCSLQLYVSVAVASVIIWPIRALALFAVFEMFFFHISHSIWIYKYFLFCFHSIGFLITGRPIASLYVFAVIYIAITLNRFIHFFAYLFILLTCPSGFSVHFCVFK